MISELIVQFLQYFTGHLSNSSINFDIIYCGWCTARHNYLKIRDSVNVSYSAQYCTFLCIIRNIKDFYELMCSKLHFPLHLRAGV